MDGEKELRSTNDFNIITSKIYKIFEEDNKYFNLQFINKTTLKKIYDQLNPVSKENIKKITLIISTPLAGDVYNLFEGFGFKNILVQSTTLSDANFIADFNYTFYQELIMHTHLKLPINEIYEVALNIDIDKTNEPIFCCCFHKHKKDCYFLKSFNYELYNNNYFEKKEEIKNLIPHFYHLFPDCPYTSKCNTFYKNKSDSEILFENQSPINSFCFIMKIAVRHFNGWLRVKEKW